ncbi:MAG: MATE family efflux transporter [Clostridiales bacterium]|nr:MATE family efflux transporter [Clostridiales bacterium]
MTTAPVPVLICELAVPTIISMLVSSFYNMADTFFVGQINTQATAAVGIVFSVMALIQAFGFFFGHGSGNFISRKLGAQETKEAEEMASCGFFYAFLGGLLMMVVGILFLEPFAMLLGSTDTILPYTKKYLRIILIGAPVMTSSLVLNNQLRFQGSAAYGMVGIVTGSVVNIVLDPLLIFVCDLGITGAAIATVASQFLSWLLLLAGSRKGGNIHIHLKNFTWKFYYLKEICRGGFPSLCRQGLASVATISLNRVAGNYSDAVIAGMSIVSRITMFANSALIGFGQGFQPVCGFNYGAKLYKRVREGFWFCVKWSAVFLAVVSVLGIVFAPQLVAVFRKDDVEVIEAGVMALRYCCIAFPLGSWIVLCNMMLQSIGKALKASIVAAARQGLFFLPLIIILPGLFGIKGVQMCQMVSDILTFLLAVPLGISVLNEMKREERISYEQK